MTLALTPQARRIAAYLEWIAYLGTFVVFAGLRELANYTGLPIHAAYAVTADTIAGRTATAWLQGLPDALDWPAILVWGSFFVVPHVVAWRAFRAGRLPQYTRPLAVMLGAAAVTHLLLPTAPPWLAGLGIERVLETRIYGLSPDVYVTGNMALGSNPVAAMPSVHVAWTVLAGLIAGWRPRTVVLSGLTMALALCYLGEHFLVDGLAGGAVAWGAWKVAR